MVWQYVITGLILLVALVLVLRRLVRVLRGRDSGSCAFCPLRESHLRQGKTRSDKSCADPPDPRVS